MTVICAPIPYATARAFAPTLPAPKMATLPGATPSRPDNSTPLPPFCFCRHQAPTWTASRPAIADIGARIGRLPSACPTVSKAMKVAPEASAASSSSGSGPKCWKPNTVWPRRGLRYSDSCSSFTLTTSSHAHGSPSVAPAFT